MTSISEELGPVVYRSPAVDFEGTWDNSSVRQKVFLITGGGSGFGKGFLESLARLGATVVIGDLTDCHVMIRNMRIEFDNEKLQLNKQTPTDVTSYESQAAFFREAKRLSGKNSIDSVIVNAGVTENNFIFEAKPFVDDPPKPNINVTQVNTVGAIYTTYLAYQYLGSSTNLSPTSYPNEDHDRSILLIGSMASFHAAPLLPQYCASKHGIFGLFRSLRYTSGASKIRINMLAPYFTPTPMLEPLGTFILAGVQLVAFDDVIKAGIRCAADYKVAGHCYAILPEVSGSIVEIFTDDMKNIEPMTSRAIQLLNAKVKADGWIYFLRALFIIIARKLLSIFWHGTPKSESKVRIE